MTKPLATFFAFALGVSAASAITVINGDFETDANLFVQWPGYTGGTGAAGTNPDQISGWLGDGGRGINPVEPGEAGDSPFDDPSSWNTTHSAFLQGTSYIEQTVTGFSVGSDYLLDLDFNSRGCCGDLPVATISLNGNVVASSVDFFGGNGAVPTMSGDDPWHHAQLSFTASTEDILVRISSTPAEGGDASLVVDNVAFTIPEPTSIALVMLSGLGLAFRRRR